MSRRMLKQSSFQHACCATALSQLVVMFADMVDYSRRLEADEVTNSAQVTRSIDLFTSLIANYGGHVANVAGDGILAL